MWRNLSSTLAGIFHGCVNEAEEDMLTIAEDKVVYKLGPDVEIAKTGT